MAEDIKLEVPLVTPMEKPAAPVIDQKTLASILARMDAQDAELKTLRSSVSQSKLTEVENKLKKPANPTGFLKVFRGKVVVGWKSEQSELLRNPANPDFIVGEVLKCRAFFIDGADSGIVDQVEFTHALTDRLEGEVLEGLKGIRDNELKEVTLHFTKLITTDEALAASFVMPPDYKINKNFLNP
jgi:hypothetical protein